MPGPYDTGDLIRITGTFKDINGNFVDPSSVFFKYKDPTNVEVTYQYGVSTIVRDSTGVYHVDLSVPISGVWIYRFYSTGTGQAANESQLVVKQSNV